MGEEPVAESVYWITSMFEFIIPSYIHTRVPHQPTSDHLNLSISSILGAESKNGQSPIKCILSELTYCTHDLKTA